MSASHLTPAETVQVDFTLAIGPGRLDASLPVPAAEVTLTQLMPVLQHLSSRIIDSTVSVIQNEGYRVSCKAGCGACCRQLVPLSIFEAEALADWIRTLPEARRIMLEERFHAALTALRDSGLLARLDPALSMVGSEADKALAIDYLRARIACPFLENESCTVHPIRPFACREYLVVSPPEFCQDPSTNPVVGVPIPLKLSTTMVKLGAVVEDSSGWVPLVFLLAWMRGGTHPGQAITGLGPELLRKIVQRLTVSPG